MEWKEVCSDPHLQNLPFKIELNEDGKIIMSPVKVYHAVLQGKIVRQLNNLLPGGEAFPECAITTDKGTRVADVVWASKERLNIIAGEDECSIAPEICIEITSSSNTAREMNEKKRLYFNKGAQEVWFCDNSGNIRFFSSGQPMEKSRLAPGFPIKIDTSLT